jgi:hypothetical protein
MFLELPKYKVLMNHTAKCSIMLFFSWGVNEELNDQRRQSSQLVAF